jgi:hypothetical protein
MLEDSKFNEAYHSPYSEFTVNVAAAALSPKKTTSPGRNSRTSRRATERLAPHNEPQDDTHANPDGVATEDTSKTGGMDPATRRVAAIHTAQKVKSTVPEDSNDPNALRNALRNLQKKYDQQAAEIRNQADEFSVLKGKIQIYTAHGVQVNILQDEMTAELDESYRREDTYACLLTFLRERDYRFSQSTNPDNQDKDFQDITITINQRGYEDVIRWIKNKVTPNSIITRLTKDNACTKAIQSKAKIMQTILEDRHQE